MNVKYVSIDISTVLYVFHDISDLKSAYDAQAESEESYRTLAENLPGLVYRLFLTEGNRIQLFNPMLEPMTGFREAEIPGGHICPLAFGIVPEDRDRIISAVSRAIDEKNPFDVEYAFSHQSGAVRYFHERGRPVFDENDVPLHRWGYF
ncbi:MAG: PAS domain-containing protein [Desulfobacterales bacterium]